jgi:hypothetical protein
MVSQWNAQKASFTFSPYFHSLLFLVLLGTRLASARSQLFLLPLLRGSPSLACANRMPTSCSKVIMTSVSPSLYSNSPHQAPTFPPSRFTPRPLPILESSTCGKEYSGVYGSKYRLLEGPWTGSRSRRSTLEGCDRSRRARVGSWRADPVQIIFSL